jgi:hypothetical protein
MNWLNCDEIGPPKEWGEIMRLLVMLLLLMPSLVYAQVGNGVAVCCGRSDMGFRNNLPPMDSIRFQQQSSGRVRFPQTPTTPHEPEASYAPPFGLYNLDEGGYNPGTGTTPPGIKEWHPTDEGWPTNDLPKYFNSHFGER